jgi:hypothetical protein
MCGTSDRGARTHARTHARTQRADAAQRAAHRGHALQGDAGRGSLAHSPGAARTLPPTATGNAPRTPCAPFPSPATLSLPPFPIRLLPLLSRAQWAPREPIRTARAAACVPRVGRHRSSHELACLLSGTGTRSAYGGATGHRLGWDQPRVALGHSKRSLARSRHSPRYSRYSRHFRGEGGGGRAFCRSTASLSARRPSSLAISTRCTHARTH